MIVSQKKNSSNDFQLFNTKHLVYIYFRVEHIYEIPSWSLSDKRNIYIYHIYWLGKYQIFKLFGGCVVGVTRF